MTAAELAGRSNLSLSVLPYPHYLATVLKLSGVLLEEFGEQIPADWRELCEVTLRAVSSAETRSTYGAGDGIQGLVERWNDFMLSEDGAGVSDDAVYGMLMHFGALANEFVDVESEPRCADDYILNGFEAQEESDERDRAFIRFTTIVRVAIDATENGADVSELRRTLHSL